MDEWIEIFRAGKYPQGDFPEERVDQVVKNYDPSFLEAPVVIGHPEDDSPAYGWVEALKRKGNVMLAKFKQLVPEFLELLKKGIYKKISVRLIEHPEKGWYLGHVGFLGGAVPQVAGLKPISFSEGGVDVEFELQGRAFGEPVDMATPADVASPMAPEEMAWDADAAAARIFDKLGINGLNKACGWFDREKPDLKGSYKLLHHDIVDGSLKVVWRGVAAVGAVMQGARGGVDIPEGDRAAVKRHIAYHYRQFDKPIPWEAQASQIQDEGGDIEMPEDKAKELEKRLRTEFADHEKALRDDFSKKLDDREKEIALLKAEVRRMEFSDYLDEVGSKLPPALREGVIEFMERLPEEETVEFTVTAGENPETKKVSPLTFFKDYLKKLPEAVIFTELATGQTPPEGDKRDQLIQEFMEKNKEASYQDAVVAVAKKHPELFKEAA